MGQTLHLEELSKEELTKQCWDRVVIGTGHSAVTNCMTLSRDSSPEHILLVGEPDPWGAYRDHKMGQFPSLLSLPGFKESLQHRRAPRKEYLTSSAFADSTGRQLAELDTSPTISIARSRVLSVLRFQDGENGDAGRWVVPVTLDNEPSAIDVTAYSVDVCTGPGDARVFSPDDPAGPWSPDIARNGFDAGLKRDLEERSKHRAFVAQDFMTVKQSSIRGKRILLVGEGPLASSIVEHALDSSAKSLTWVGRSTRLPLISFPESTRYDRLVPGVAALRELRNSDEQKWLDAVSSNLRPVDHSVEIVLGSVSRLESSSATIETTSGHGHVLEISHNACRSDRSKTLRSFDLVVISASSASKTTETGSAAFLVSSVCHDLGRLRAIQHCEIFAGLELHVRADTPSGRGASLRVLGSASRSPDLEGAFPDQTNRTLHYARWHDDLCAQARMENRAMSIPVGGATIAHANQFYSSERPDRCAQTASREDVAGARLPRERSSEVTPYSAEDLRQTQDPRLEEFPRPSAD